MKASRQALFLALMLQLSLTGCASFVNDANQRIKVEVYSKDKVIVKGTNCVGSNDYGEFTADRYGFINIHRSRKDLLITCTKYGEESGFGLLISRVTGAIYGNILIGGAVGAALDHGGGAAYAYPDWVRIILGEDLIFDQKDSKKNPSQKNSKENKRLLDKTLPMPTIKKVGE